MSHLVWKRSLGRLLGRSASAGPRRIILLYHALGPRPPAVMAAAFREQVAWLADHATLTTLPALLQNTATAGLQVALTFDDGYASLHDAVAPILQHYHACATVYLNTGHIGGQQRQQSDPRQGHYPDQQFLVWPEVQALAGAGWCIGSHGVAHLDLTRMPAASVAQELADSKSAIEGRLGSQCQHFAYTWGRYTPLLQQQVRAAGYASAASGLHGPLTASSDPYALPRIDVRADYELRDFIAVVTGRWDWLGHKQRILRRFT